MEYIAGGTVGGAVIGPWQDISFTSNSYNVSELFKTPPDSIIEPHELALKL